MDRNSLLYFKELLERQLDQVSMRMVRGFPGPDCHDDERGPMDEADLATTRSAREWAYRMQSRNHRLQREIGDALQRIRDGEFGICSECNDGIAIERLKATPWTHVCIDCKRREELGGRLNAA
jgi:DnaK suppressor protein